VLQALLLLLPLRCLGSLGGCDLVVGCLDYQVHAEVLFRGLFPIKKQGRQNESHPDIDSN